VLKGWTMIHPPIPPMPPVAKLMLVGSTLAFLASAARRRKGKIRLASDL
jgi:hypothetical protein